MQGPSQQPHVLLIIAAATHLATVVVCPNFPREPVGSRHIRTLFCSVFVTPALGKTIGPQYMFIGCSPSFLRSFHQSFFYFLFPFSFFFSSFSPFFFFFPPFPFLPSLLPSQEPKGQKCLYIFHIHHNITVILFGCLWALSGIGGCSKLTFFGCSSRC